MHKASKDAFFSFSSQSSFQKSNMLSINKQINTEKTPYWCQIYANRVSHNYYNTFKIFRYMLWTVSFIWYAFARCLFSFDKVFKSFCWRRVRLFGFFNQIYREPFKQGFIAVSLRRTASIASLSSFMTWNLSNVTEAVGRYFFAPDINAVDISLSIITFGIYGIYWLYLLVKNTRSIQKNTTSCTGEMLCLIFVPFYSLYWWYTRGENVKQEFSQHNYASTGNGIVYLILAIFGLSIVSMAIMQCDFNSLKPETHSEQRSTTKVCIITSAT